MSPLFALVLAAAAPAVPEPAEIVVIGQRLQGLNVQVVQDREGRWHCGMDGTSGVAALDGRLCEAATKCVRKGAASETEVRECITRNKASLLARFTREWRERRQ